MVVRTRFAPSPTGSLHIGGVRTALYCYLFARRHGGEYLLRIEDTDQERSTQASVDIILDGMAWLGLEADQPPVFQTQRLERYQEAIAQLIDNNHAYYCFCTSEELDAMRTAQRERGEKPRYDRRHRDEGRRPQPGEPHVVRFKSPLQGSVSFNDGVFGAITVANDELDDLVIQRTDGLPTYNFAVVVDDNDMAISHVIRGDDHINNTPRQINICTALGYAIPEFAHLPMILGSDGQRLSKRHGAVSVLDYRDDGYLPEALLNYLVRLGWSHGDREEFTLAEMTDLFSLEGVNRAAASFNVEKLNWLNEQYLRRTDSAQLAQMLESYAAAKGAPLQAPPSSVAIVDALKERASTTQDLFDQSRVFYEPLPAMDDKAATKQLKPAAKQPLDLLKSKLITLDEWQAGKIHDAMMATLGELDLKFGKLGPPLRVAVTGNTQGPAVDVTLFLMGRDRVMQGIDRALDYIEQRSGSDTA